MTPSARVASLLSALSLPRKAAQMVQAERLHISPEQVRRHGVGSVLSGAGSLPGGNRPEDWVAMNDAYWAASVAGWDGEPGIPLLYAVDAVHGHNNVLGATVFPQNIGLGAANDPALVERVARVTAREVLATGLDWNLAPTLAVAGDCRWGRTYESFSEVPGPVAEYALRIVRGLQAGLGPDGVLACPKHWAGDGGTMEGVDQGNTLANEADLRRTHMSAYGPALEAGALAVMVSLSRWRGVLCHEHRYLITDVLKGELGFSGFVVSDWNGIFAISDDFGRAVARSVNAGIDLFMIPEQWERFIAEVVRQVENGNIDEARVDDAVGRILGVKEACGLFERPRPAARKWSNHASFGSAEHRDVAREAVRRSLVLLKHEGNVLPLDRDARILVAGRNAHDRGAQCGGFTLEWQGVRGNDRIEGGASIWEGIKHMAPRARRLAESDLAKQGGRFDAAVVVIGEKPYAEGMGDIRDWTPAASSARSGSEAQAPAPGPGLLRPYGDTLRLSRLHPEDLAIIRSLRARDLPVVAVLVSGRPFVVTEELEVATAFVAAWLPGSEGGGVAEVLFGDYDFRGRLAHAWPANDVARGEPAETLFPVGYGLTAGSQLGARRDEAAIQPAARGD